MRRLIASLLFVFSLSIPLPVVVAQSDAPTCNPSAVFEYMKSLKSASDTTKDVATLVDLQLIITAQNIACNGFTYNGSGNAVTNPFPLARGLHRVHVKADAGVMNITLKVLFGACRGSLGDTVMLVSSMQGDIDDEGLITSEGCRIVLDVQYAGMGKRDWTLTIEPLS